MPAGSAEVARLVAKAPPCGCIVALSLCAGNSTGTARGEVRGWGECERAASGSCGVSWLVEDEAHASGAEESREGRGTLCAGSTKPAVGEAVVSNCPCGLEGAVDGHCAPLAAHCVPLSDAGPIARP